MKACVDIGGTKIAVSLANAQGWQWRGSCATPKTGPRESLSSAVLQLIDAGARQLGTGISQIDAVGVSSCGPFHRADGYLELVTPNICGALSGHGTGCCNGPANDWASVPLERALREKFAQVRIENDAVAALQAEARWGALAGIADCAYATWSTGVGFGIQLNGQILRGKNGNAGHAGHVFVAENETARCGCGNAGDLEALVSGSALESRFGRSASVLFADAKAGQADALDGLSIAVKRFATALYNLTVTLDLARISIGGSVFLHHCDWLLPRIQAHVQGKFPLITDELEIVSAGLGDKVGDYAALSLVAEPGWDWAK